MLLGLQLLSNNFHTKMKSFLSLVGPYPGTDVCYSSPQPNASVHCETMDKTLVHCTVCMFGPSFWRYAQTELIWMAVLYTEIVYPPTDGYPS